MSDSVVDDAARQDDTIILNGVELPVISPIQPGLVSEFSTGLKVGSASYDEREHAYWTVFDNFSGGFGFRQADVREAGGTHWDNVGGVDLRRPRHITLPPRRNTISAANNPATGALFFAHESAYYTDLGPDTNGNLWLGVFEDILVMDSERAVLTRKYDGSTDSNTTLRVGRIVESVTTTGTRILLATGSVGTGSHEYLLSIDSGTNWLKSSAVNSGSGATGTTTSSVQLSDAIVYRTDSGPIIIAHGEGDQIIATADGVAWDTDAAGNLDTRWRTGDPAIKFIGVAMAPWGDSAVYFISMDRLWILDWGRHEAIQVQDVGDNNKLLPMGAMWNGSVIVTDGWNVWEYNPGNAQTVRRIGIFGKDGPPPSWVADTGHAGLGNDYHITNLITGTADLFAICRSLTAPRSWRVAVYNGVGWSWLGPEVASSQPYAGTIDLFPTGTSLAATTRALDVVALQDQNPGTPAVTLHTFYLPTTGDIPFRGVGQRFEDGPLTFETGWFDGGFAELEGVLLKMSIDGYHITDTETIKVEYRLDNNEKGTYVELGTYTMNQQSHWFTTDHRGKEFKSVQFRITLDRGIGVDFVDSTTDLNEDLDNSETGVDVDDTAVFRVGDVIRVDSEQMLITAKTVTGNTLTVTRGYNSTSAVTHSNNANVYVETGVTPELRALVLLFDEKPHARTSWNIAIDVGKAKAAGYTINEELATTEVLWQFLKSLVNTPRLLELKIPSLESGGVNVRITNMPGSISDFRAAVGGRGVFNLQLIETVAS